MWRAIVSTTLAAGAAGFLASAPAAPASKLFSSDYAKTLYGIGPETAYWDPLNLADLGTDLTVDFFRAAEVKHGRVAMMACLGYFHHMAGVQLPGYLSNAEGLKFVDLGAVKASEARRRRRICSEGHTHTHTHT